MGNYRFKISDMMPNSWLYKLKNMGRSSHRATHPTPTRKKQPKSIAPPQTEPYSNSSTPRKHHLSQSRKSYYFAREHLPNSPADKPQFPDPPRKSSRGKSSRRSPHRQFPSPVSTAAVCCEVRRSVETAAPEFTVSPLESSPESEFGDHLAREFRSDSVLPTESSDAMVSLSWSSSSCGCGGGGGGPNSTPNDIEIDLKSFSKGTGAKVSEYAAVGVVPELDLPPIVTKKMPPLKSSRNLKKTETPRKKPARTNSRNGSDANAKEPKASSPGRRISAHSPVGVRLRVNSPKIGGRRFQGSRRSISSNTSSELSAARRSVSDSFAVVKASVDPGSDFRESMVEMILQNNIWESKDLEELLACYLSLNSDEYHDIIITVFKQIWLDLTDARRVKLF